MKLTRMSLWQKLCLLARLTLSLVALAYLASTAERVAELVKDTGVS